MYFGYKRHGKRGWPFKCDELPHDSHTGKPRNDYVQLRELLPGQKFMSLKLLEKLYPYEPPEEE